MGAERVVVSQLHRSPGVDFVTSSESSERKTHNCRIIPERGSWIELNVSKKDTLQVRIDQSGKFSALTLLRAMDKKFSSDTEILKLFIKVLLKRLSAQRVFLKLRAKLRLTMLCIRLRANEQARSSWRLAVKLRMIKLS